MLEPPKQDARFEQQLVLMPFFSSGLVEEAADQEAAALHSRLCDSWKCHILLTAVSSKFKYRPSLQAPILRSPYICVSCAYLLSISMRP